MKALSSSRQETLLAAPWRLFELVVRAAVPLTTHKCYRGDDSREEEVEVEVEAEVEGEGEGKGRWRR